EAKDLTTLPLEQLLESLMTHETAVKSQESEETKKKKTVAFRASKKENEDVSDEDKEMARITKGFKKFLSKKRQQGKRPFKKHLQMGESRKKEKVISYDCNKPGHYKNDPRR
ncbi:hypothetical protein CFOL_v3_31725, partial [Cephalotus follicularis]